MSHSIVWAFHVTVTAASWTRMATSITIRLPGWHCGLLLHVTITQIPVAANRSSAAGAGITNGAETVQSIQMISVD